MSSDEGRRPSPPRADSPNIRLLHAMEPYNYSYEQGFAWFCDASGVGADCRQVHQRAEVVATVPAIPRRFVRERLLDLGCEESRNQAVGALRRLRDLTEREKTLIDELLLTTRSLIGNLERSLGKSTQLEVAEEATKYPAHSAISLAVPASGSGGIATVSIEQFYAALRGVDRHVFFKNFKNEEAIAVAALLRRAGYDGWQVRPDAVVTISWKSEGPPRVARVERETQEYLIDVRQPRRDYFKAFRRSSPFRARRVEWPGRKSP